MTMQPIQATVTRSGTTKPVTLTAANRQWSTRPADERFDSLGALLESTKRHARCAVSMAMPLNKCEVIPQGSGLALRGPQGGIVEPSHWAFGQLCGHAGAPAAYLRTLPADLAANCLNTGLKADDTERHLLIDREDLSLRAINGARYRRVWNHEVAQALVDLRERAPFWQFPEPFRTVGGKAANAWGKADGKQVPVAFASDHDMFAFLVDYDHPIEVGGSPLARGFFAENSEVGAASFKLTTFLFDFVCSNILVWGARNVTEIAIPHIGTVRERVLKGDGEVLTHLQTYANMEASVQEDQIRRAQVLLLGADREEVVSMLFKAVGISKAALECAYTVAATTPRYGNPNTAWAMVNGLTEVSQQSEYTDERIKLDRAAGEILNFVF